jgi:uncharacterized protein
VKRILLVLLLVQVALATTPEEVPNPRTRNSWVTDLAGVLTVSSRDRIDQLANQLQARNGTQLAVVVLKNVDRTPKAFATALFNRWGIGQKGLNNGVLMLVVMEQRRIEIEVGDGARQFMPDGRTAAVLEHDVIPSFKAGRPEAGILGGVTSICNVLGTVSYQARARVSSQPAVSDYSDALSGEI